MEISRITVQCTETQHLIMVIHVMISKEHIVYTLWSAQWVWQAPPTLGRCWALSTIMVASRLESPSSSLRGGSNTIRDLLMVRLRRRNWGRGRREGKREGRREGTKRGEGSRGG